ncbi:RICIN domain-containing protein [Streptomyces zhihengii]
MAGAAGRRRRKHGARQPGRSARRTDLRQPVDRGLSGQQPGQGLRAYECNGLPYQRWTVREMPGDGVQLRNHATGRCLDHDAGLHAAVCGSSATQRWTLVPRDEGAVEVRNAESRHCLDADTTDLRVLPCTRATRQMWA